MKDSLSAGDVDEIDGGSMLAWLGGPSINETDGVLAVQPGTVEVVEVLRCPGVLAVLPGSEVHDVFGLRHIVASLDHASVSLRGRC